MTATATATPPISDPTLHAARRAFLVTLAQAHADAHAVGLVKTAAVLHAAVQQAGWEQAQLETTLGWSFDTPPQE